MKAWGSGRQDMPNAVRVKMTDLGPPCSDVFISKSDTLHEDHASARGILLVLEARELEV